MNDCDDLRDLQLAGVQWEIEDTPITLRAHAATAAQTAATPSTAAPKAAGVATQHAATTNTIAVPPIAPVAHDSAEKIAAAAGTIAELIAELRGFEHPLRATATTVVMPHIAENQGPLMILTDGPGADDDAAGKILTGAGGELLDKMLGAIGLSRDVVSIVPMLFWRTPGGRSPSRVELDLARPFVMRMIEMIAPRAILSLGTLPAGEVAGLNLAKSHGVRTDVLGRPFMPIYHPNYLMLKPATKRDAWGALQELQNLLKTL